MLAQIHLSVSQFFFSNWETSILAKQLGQEPLGMKEYNSRAFSTFQVRLGTDEKKGKNMDTN